MKRTIIGIALIGFILLGYLHINSITTVVEKTHSMAIVGDLRDYNRNGMENITIYYKDQDEKNINEIKKIMKRSKRQVEQNFQEITPKNLNLVVYPNSMEMNKGLKLPSGDRTLGAYYGGNIFVLSPSTLNKGSQELENVIIHEYTHLLVEKITQGNHPLWFSEGMALYLEYILTGYEWGEDSNFLRDSNLTMEQLEKEFNRIDPNISYRESFLRVQFLEERFGYASLIEIMEDMGKNHSYNQSIENVLNIDAKALEDQFKLWYGEKDYGKLV